MENKHEKIFRITCHYRNAIQNHIEITILEWLQFLKMENIACCCECREIGTLVYTWWEYKTLQPRWKTVCWFLKKVKIELPYDSAFHSYVFTQRNSKHELKQICQCSQQHHSQERKGGNNTNVHQHVNGLIKRGK